MKTENLSIGLRVLYHSIEWLTVCLLYTSDAADE